MAATVQAENKTTHTRTRSEHPAAGRQIIGLDLVRFTAALLVVGFHLGYWNRTGHNGLDSLAYLAPYTSTGWVGVQIFFVLSGFVIAYSAEKSTPASFARNRFIRLYPAVWICSTITLLVIAILGGLNRGLILPAICSFLLSPYGAQIDGSYWTLSIEITFYLLIFALLLTHRFHYLQPVMITVAAISTAFHLCIYALEQHLLPGGHIGALLIHFFDTRTAQLLLLRHGAIFALGVLLWLSLMHRWTPGRTLAMVFCCFGGLLSIREDWIRVVDSTGHSFSSMPTIIVWLISLVCIIVSVQANDKIAQFVGPRGARAARLLGLVTYPLYLLHQRAGDAILFRLHGHIPDIVSFILVVALFLALSFIIVLYLEKPIQEQLRRLLHGRPKSIPTPAATLP